MRMTYLIGLFAAGVTMCAHHSSAQERKPGQEAPNPLQVRESMLFRMNPILGALDTNRDGVIDEKEIANAPAALKKLDKNGDGKLTEDELRPVPTPRSTVGAASASAELVRRLMEFDKNGDGKLSKDELPERMQSLFERSDTDHDGFLSKDELAKMSESRTPTPGRGRFEEKQRTEPKPPQPPSDK